MRAVRLAAFGVQVEGVFLDEKAAVLGDFFLAPFYFFDEKFFDPATIDADQVVVVLSSLDFKHGLAGLEMVAFKEAGLLELTRNAQVAGCRRAQQRKTIGHLEEDAILAAFGLLLGQRRAG